MMPFSDEEGHKDSTMFEGQLVEHLTSWLTINPMKGCSLRCAYCFRANWYELEKPQQVNSLDDCFSELLAHPIFRPHETPISINNSSTDPLLPGVRKITFEAIERLENMEYRNPFIIISKLQLSKDELLFLSELKFIRPIFFSSFSLSPKHIEPTPIQPRLNNMRNLRALGIKTVLYYRPIVKGWNDSLEIIEKALQAGQDYCDAICIGGLRMSREIRLELQKVGEDFTDFPDDFHQKIFQEDIEAKILNVYKSQGFSVPLFKHSSCAVSFILEKANYNHLFKNPMKNCLESCPVNQQLLCKNGN